MSEAKHQPGPWIPTPSDHKGAIYGSVIAPECDCSDYDKGRGDHEGYGGHLIAESIAERNKPIIAAAPDLYAACERLITNLDNGKPLTGAFLNIREALAKAKGES